MHVQLVPKSTTFDNLEWLLRTLLHHSQSLKKLQINAEPKQKIPNDDRPTVSVAEMPATIVSTHSQITAST